MNFRDEKLLKSFGRHLAELRKREKFTQESLAFESGLTLSQVARIETGAVNPTFCTLNQIAKALSLPLKDLFDFKTK